MAEYDTAAIHFRKAAYLLSCGKPLGNLHEMSSGLLDIVSVDSFYNGLAKYFQHILSVFEEVRSFSHVAEFATVALQALESEHSSEDDVAGLRIDLLSHLFHASLTTCRFDQAYSAASRFVDRALQKSALGLLVTTVLTVSGTGTAGLDKLLHFPTSLVPNIASYVDETLVALCDKQTNFASFVDEEVAEGNKYTSSWDTDNNSSPDYSRILQAYRISQSDYRGAAEIAYRNVQRLRKARDEPAAYRIFKKRRVNGNVDSGQTIEEDDPESKEIRHELLALINLLACVDRSEAYIVVVRDDDSVVHDHAVTQVDDEEGNVTMNGVDGTSHNTTSPSPFGLYSSQPQQHANAPRRRVIVTLEHLRREYQGELDRISRIERGDWEFGFGDDDESGEEGDGDETMVLS